jgi:hypothetical protein
LRSSSTTGSFATRRFPSAFMAMNIGISCRKSQALD